MKDPISHRVVLVVQPMQKGVHTFRALSQALRIDHVFVDTWITPYTNLHEDFRRLLGAIDQYRQGEPDGHMVVLLMPWWTSATWAARWTPNAERFLEEGLRERGIHLLRPTARRDAQFRLEIANLKRLRNTILDIYLQERNAARERAAQAAKEALRIELETVEKYSYTGRPYVSGEGENRQWIFPEEEDENDIVATSTKHLVILYPTSSGSSTWDKLERAAVALGWTVREFEADDPLEDSVEDLFASHIDPFLQAKCPVVIARPPMQFSMTWWGNRGTAKAWSQYIQKLECRAGVREIEFEVIDNGFDGPFGFRPDEPVDDIMNRAEGMLASLKNQRNKA